MIFDRLQEHTVRIYDLKNKQYEIQDIQARTLLVGERFDLFAKLFYIKYRKTNRNLALEVYNKHIKVFNPDLKEPGREDKNGYDAFVNAFDKLIDDIELNGFDPNKSLVPVDENGILLDGAHRVCTLAYTNKTVRIVRFKSVHSKGRFNYEYFLKRGLSWKIADIIAHEMVLWCPNILIACLWPRMGGTEAKNNTLKLINHRYPILYTKTINTNLESFVHFIAKVYEAQNWVGNASNGFSGARDKALNCFGSNKQITFALFEANDLDSVIQLKNEIRKYFQSEKHSIHITDNANETKEIAKVILNEKELISWNKIKNSFVQKTKELINEKIYYFKNVTLINWKVTVVAAINRIKQWNNDEKNI